MYGAMVELDEQVIKIKVVKDTQGYLYADEENKLVDIKAGRECYALETSEVIILLKDGFDENNIYEYYMEVIPKAACFFAGAESFNGCAGFIEDGAYQKYTDKFTRLCEDLYKTLYEEDGDEEDIEYTDCSSYGKMKKNLNLEQRA